MKNQFAKFVIGILAFFILLLLADRVVANIEDRLYARKDNKINYAAYNKEPIDIVILGSSRASHHYIPKIIEDTMGMTCVNLGTEGHGIMYNYALYHLMLKKNTPQIIIYEFGAFDWQEGGYANDKALVSLSPIYNIDKTTDSLIERCNERYKSYYSCFHSIKYNNKIHKAILPSYDIASHAGYDPLYGKFIENSDTNDKSESLQISKDKLQYIERLIDNCKAKGIELIFVSSPQYFPPHKEDVTEEIASAFREKKEIKYLDYRTKAHHKEYFYDATHLNDEGAKWYTTLFVSDLKKLLSQENVGLADSQNQN